MINKIYIETESRNVYPERDILGISGENKFETLQFNLDNFIDGQALLRVERKETNGTAQYEISVEKGDNCYTLEVLSSLLMYKGLIKMQLVIMQENLEVFKSKSFNMKVLEEIEGTQEIPEQYPSWQQLANQKIIEMNNKITEVTALEEDLSDKVESGYFKGEKGDTGEPGQNGTDGLNGTDGKSAYQIWLDEGNIGTEQDFLDSLKGADGRNGIDGKNGKDGINGTNGQDGYTPIKGTDYWTNADKAEIVQSSVTQVEADIQSTITSIENTADTANSTANIAKSIAEGANQALSYGNYQTMITAFNALANNVYNVGQNVMIITLNVPDLWISGIESTSQSYTYTTDEAFTTELSTNGYVQVGYYKLSALETQKVDLTNYVTNTDYATSTVGGVIKHSGTSYGTRIASGFLTANIKNYSDYLTSNDYYFIGKGTLENVITGKQLVDKTYVDNLFNSIVDGDEVSY